MKKDIIRYKVEGVRMAIARKKSGGKDFNWHVYIINDNDFSLNYVLITSKGYGKMNGKEKKTSVLRQMFDQVEPQSYQVVEPIKPELFSLCNEFWVSYYLGRDIYDKKFVFLPEAMNDEYLTHIDKIGLEGILHS